ncbi:hypothetical protein K1T71_005155 [Dendrolimus kikuchii]|uniref:Uncharacterized protein n=1 Tax=Dendrolimus kikuchii TaxID=765133 RepID=A0ACC1D770_9NEOP|nr:hypothetical protein K1T71_005155 [Dendrolimus kikuchii]
MEEDTVAESAEILAPDRVDAEIKEDDEKVGKEVSVLEEIRGEGLEEAEGEELENEQVQGEHVEGEMKEKVLREGEELMGEEVEGEGVENEEKEEKKEEAQPVVEEVIEEEERFVEEPPPDPAAPFDFSDSKEVLKEPFELRPDQVVEVEMLWEFYQNYTPAYTDIDGYITEKELIYMLKAILLMTYTPEQLQELIAYCVRPPHPEGHISFEQFLKMVTIRQRDFPIEDELRTSLQVLDPDKTGSVDREYLKEVLSKLGHKMPQKQMENLIKEVDMSNDGTIGIEDVVGTMCIDLNKEDLIMLMNSIFPPDERVPAEEDI